MEGVLRRLVGAVTRRPLLVLAVTAVLALGGAVLALRLEPSAATETLVDQGSETFRDTERFKHDFGDEAILVLVRGDLSRTVLTADLGRLIRLEGCLSGNVPDNKEGLAKLPPVCRDIAELHPAKVVYGPGTFINTAAGQIQDQFTREQQKAAAEAQRVGGGGAAALEAPRRPAGRAGAARAERRSGRPGEVHQRDAAARPSLRAERRAARRRPGLRVGARVRPDRGAGTARRAWESEGALRLPVPVEERRADPGPAAARPHRLRAPARDRPDPHGHGREGVPPARGRQVHRDRRAGRGRRPGRLDPDRDLRAARRGSPADGGHARARVPVAAAAAAARARARRRGDDLRRPVGGGRRPHDGVDSGAAGADRTGGGLRDPVPGALRRGRGPGRAEPAVAAAVAGGPTILTAGLATATGFLVLLLSPVPMVRGFGLLLVVGIVLALACALCAGFAALTRFAPPAARAGGRAAPCARRGRGARRRAARAPARPCRGRVARGPVVAHARVRALAAAAGARDRAGGGRGRARAGHAERGGLRRARARPAGPPGARRT